MKLGPDAFERFCCDLVHSLPEVRRSHRHGGQGDAQQGIDISATTVGGRRWVFQCKRVRQFRPAHLRKAISAASREADRYFLLLGSPASSSLRNEIEKHPGWELWDAEEISWRVRQLPSETARTLVDAHFGADWCKAFLGLEGPAPFVSASVFFAPLLDRSRLFHHSWTTVGRQDAVQSLLRFSRSSESRIAVLPGRGGIGKSKVLHAFAQAADPSLSLRFRVRGIPLAPASFDHLDPVPCVVVVDDAHQRDDLPFLLAAVRRRDPPIKLVLSIRPHARDRILGDITRAGFDQRETELLDELRALSLAESGDLAKEALGPAYAHLAGALAVLSADSPLVTVLGGKLIASERLHPALLSQHHEFQRAVLDAFQDALWGNLGGRADAKLCRKLLRLSSAVGPFRADIQAFRGAACKFLEASQSELLEAIGEMESAGVLLRRGRMLRVTPDVLSDHVLEQACIANDGTPTGYAGNVYAAFKDLALGPLLQNLAELDWRRYHGGGATSGDLLLRDIWSELDRELRTASDARRAELVRLVGVAAFYQPGPSLRLVRTAMRASAAALSEGKESGRQQVALELPRVLEKIAWNVEYTVECCDLLWRLARDDTRHPVSDLYHPVSVLQELASYRSHKPVILQEAVLTAVERWLAQPDAFDHVHSPLDVLYQFFAKTVNDVLGPLPVAPGPTAAIREQAIRIVLRLLRHDDMRFVLHGVRSLGVILQEPIPLMSMELPDGFAGLWLPEQRRALTLLADVCERSSHPRVLLECLQVLARSAERRGTGLLARDAREQAASVDRSFDLRFSETLGRLSITAVYDTEPWTTHFRDLGAWDRLEKGRRDTAAEFLSRYAEPEDGFARIAVEIQALEALGFEVSCASLAAHIADLDPGYTADLCEKVIASPASPVQRHLAPFLYRIKKPCPAHYLRLASHILADGDGQYAGALAATLWELEDPGLTEADDLLAQALAHVDEEVRWTALPALHQLARRGPERALDLALRMEVGRSARVAGRLAELFSGMWGIDPEQLPARTWNALLEKLLPAETLDHYEILVFLRNGSRHAPRAVARLLVSRVTRAESEPIPYEPLPSMEARALDGFASCPEHDLILREVRDLILQLPSPAIQYLPRLYQLVSAGYGPAGIRVLHEWIDSGIPRKFAGACELLREIPAVVLLQEPDFIERVLVQADALGDAVLDSVCAMLHHVASRAKEEPRDEGSAWPGVLELRDRGRSIASGPHRSSLFRGFYRGLADLTETWIRDVLAADEELYS